MAAKWLKSIPNLWLKGWKTIPFGAAHTYIAHIREYPSREEGYCEEYITDILPIHHWQTTDILPRADRKVAIDTSTDIQCVVIASIDRHSIECQWKLKVCRPRCRSRVDRDVDRVSIAGRMRCRLLVSIDTRSWVSIVHMILIFL